MNRKLYLSVMSFFVVVFIITFSFLPYYNPIYFYLQHISLFLFVAMLLHFLLQLGFNRLNKKVKSHTVSRGYTIAVLAIVLIGFSSLQLSYIEKYQTKEQQYCTYYDSFGNLVFESYQPITCPKLEVIDRTRDVFIFSITENYEGEAEKGYMNLDNDKVYSYEGEKSSLISIQYNDFHYAANVVVESESKILLTYENEEFKVYNYLKHSVNNQIIYDDQNVFRIESKQVKEVIKDTFVDYTQESNISALQPGIEYKMYRSTKYYNNQESDYQMVLEEGYFTDSSYTTLINNSTIYSIIDVYTSEGLYDLRIGEYAYSPIAIDFDTEGYVNDRDESYIEYDSNNIVVGQPYYFTSGNDTRVTTYNAFHSYRGMIMNSDVKPSVTLFYAPLERSSFTYNGKEYLEHGGYYTVFTSQDYGMSLSTKSSQNDKEDKNEPYLYWISIDNDESPFDNEFTNIYDYRYGFNTPYNESNTPVYQWNPLVFFLID